MRVSSAAFGVVAGFYPICTIVIAAIFLYKLTVRTEQFNVIRDSISSITSDPRLQVLLIAYSFGAFLEGAAGFGVPVAITAALLVGMGFDPLKAAGICLVANIAGGTMGAMGIPITVPAQLDIVPSTLVALNVVGGTIAKMVSPQSVAVACAAVGIIGKESELFKTTMKYSLIFLFIISLLQLNAVLHIF